MANYTISKIKLPNGDICNIKDTTYTAGNGINISNNQINWDWKVISENSPNLYKYIMTYTTTTAPTSDWYVKIILDRMWNPELTPIVIKAAYCNIAGILYLSLDSHSSYFKAYRTSYGDGNNNSNILAIKRINENSKNTIYLKLRQSKQYQGTIPQGTLTVYSPVSITSIEETTDPNNMIELADGYTSNTYVKANGFYGPLTGDVTGNVTGNVSGSAGSVALSGVTNADNLKAIEALTGTSGFLKKTAANTWALDACDDVVKKRDFLLTESNEEVDLIKLKPGVYDHISSFNNFLPTNWGTLLHIGGKYKYGAFIAAESANILYYKTYFYESDDNWFWREENWQTIAHATKSTSNIGSATQPVYMTSTGVITAGTALKALAYKNNLVASDIPELSTDKLTSGTLPIERGGTNATTAANATWNLLHISDPSDLNTAKRMGSFKISNSTTNTPESSMWGATWNIVDDNPNGNNGTSGSTWQLVFKAASTDMWLRTVTNNNNWTDYAKFLTDKHLQDGITSTSTTLAATANAAYTASRNSLHTLGTTTKFYLTGCSSSTTNTAGDIFDTGIYSTTTAGELSAVRHTLNLNGTDKAYMTWNNTDQSIDFIFN